MRYKNDEKWLFRLIYWIFKDCRNIAMINYITTKLKLSDEKILEMIQYKYPQKTSIYFKHKIMVQNIRKNKLNILKKLKEIMGEKVFIEKVFEVDMKNMNGFETAIRWNKLDQIKYLMSFNEIKEKC